MLVAHIWASSATVEHAIAYEDLAFILFIDRLIVDFEWVTFIALLKSPAQFNGL